MSRTGTHKPREIFIEGPILPDFISDSIAKHAARQGIGAHEIFLGQVRADGKPLHDQVRDEGGIGTEHPYVTSIEYSTYREMAHESMTAIREETFARWPITCLHVHHSLGLVRAGELCFLVFASAPHREAAREAVAYVTDEVKKRLPIFGKERLNNDQHRWKRNR